MAQILVLLLMIGVGYFSAFGNRLPFVLLFLLPFAFAFIAPSVETRYDMWWIHHLEEREQPYFLFMSQMKGFVIYAVQHWPVATYGTPIVLLVTRELTRLYYLLQGRPLDMPWWQKTRL